MSKLISIVIPVFNEGEGIISFVEELLKHCGKKFEYELIFIDDGSTDATFSLLYELQKKNNQIKIVRLTRNFGHQAALSAGLELAQGHAIITMDADFQDPPSLVPDLINLWEKGSKVVFTRRKNRKDNLFKRITASIYYYILYQFSDIKIKGNVGDYRLIDQSIHEKLKNINEKSNYLRGLISWLGYDYSILEFNRPKRKFGKSKFSFLKMFRLGMEGILNFSLVPLRIGLLLGLIIVPIGIVFFIYIVIDTLLFNQIYPLYKWITVLTLTFQGFMFILMWILAEFVGKIYDQKGAKPQYVVAEKINFK